MRRVLESLSRPHDVCEHSSQDSGDLIASQWDTRRSCKEGRGQPGLPSHWTKELQFQQGFRSVVVATVAQGEPYMGLLPH